MCAVSFYLFKALRKIGSSALLKMLAHFIFYFIMYLVSIEEKLVD